ncbi:MAG: putative manganese-dependent inorganic diphosphatase [Erysipelotrichaceae bacterium]
MQELIHIIGHKNPDTDSIMASIGYAELKRKLGINAIACRIGEVNSETAYILKKFEMEEPIYIQNARLKLYDVPFDMPLTITKKKTLKEAWDKMCSGNNDEGRSNSLYVVDQEDKLLGVISLSDIAHILLNPKGNIKTLMEDTPVENICEVLEGDLIYKPERFRRKGNVYVNVVYTRDVHDVDYHDSIVVMNDDLQMQRHVIDNGASCLILVGIDIVSKQIIASAKENGCTIIRTNKAMMDVTNTIYQSIPVSSIMGRKIVSFNNHEYIDDVYKKMSQTRYRSYPVLNNQGKVLGAISRFHLLNYQKKKFILVDHNEMSQSIDNIKDADILEIVDHHRIGDIETSSPIRFRNEIIGSTCSIVAMMYRENRILPDPKVAAGMCYAIISDTMNFNSPTTTPIDHDLAQELADIAGINLENIAPEMFKAVATLKGKNLSEILYNDFKEYAIEGKRIAIGQINLADIHELEEIRSDFIEYLKTINTINKFDLLMMCFTNVEGKGSNLIFIGELSWMVDEAFKEDIMDDNYFVDGIMSRKKQIIPSLSRIIKED